MAGLLQVLLWHQVCRACSQDRSMILSQQCISMLLIGLFMYGPQGCQEGPLIRSFQDPGNNRVNMKASEGRFSMENRMDKPSGPLKGQAWGAILDPGLPCRPALLVKQVKEGEGR